MPITWTRSSSPWARTASNEPLAGAGVTLPADYAPFGFQAGDENLYRYVSNNPTNAVDPNGLEAVELAPGPQVAAASYELSFSEGAQPATGPYGAFVWPVLWHLTPKAGRDGGSVVQWIHIETDITFLEGPFKGRKFANEHLTKAVSDWVETWQVPPNGDEVKAIMWRNLSEKTHRAYERSGVKVEPDLCGNDWFFLPKARGAEKTRGRITIYALAAYYDKLTADVLTTWKFTRGGVFTGAGQLLAYRLDQPGNRAYIQKLLSGYPDHSPSIEHNLVVEWGADGKTSAHQFVYFIGPLMGMTPK